MSPIRAAAPSYVYDALGRQTLVPAGAGPGGLDIEIAYFDDDVARSITTGGTSTTFDLDALARRSVTTTTGESPSVVTRVYSDTSDNPSGAREVAGGVTRTSSYAGAIAGDVLYAQVDSDEATLTSVGIADPIGSVVATHTLSDVGGARTALPGDGSGLAVYDEYGNRTGAGVKAGALDYGWLGGKERASDASGLVLMGVRLFNSVTGLFTSVDPVVGGNETVYGYPNDPVNKLDLDGRRGWWSRNWKKVVVGVVVTAVVVGAVACIAASAGTCAGAIGAAAGRAALGAARVGARTAARAASRSPKAYKLLDKIGGPQSRLLGNYSLRNPVTGRQAARPGLINNARRGSGKPALGWAVGPNKRGVYGQNLRFKSRSGNHFDIYYGRRF